MKEQQLKLIEYLKNLEVDGCITGSALLGQYFPGADVDFFCYSDKAFIKMFYQLYHDPKFQILSKLEAWKADQFMNSESKDFKFGIQTIKFTYNTCIELNIIRKVKCNNAFSVISSFDMDIVAKAWDNSSKQYLDLSGDSHKTNIANINKWNPKYNSNEIWDISRILRQFERVCKYYKRGYDTDNVAKEYLKIIDRLQEYQSVFSSETFNDKLQLLKDNTIIIKQIIEVWLKNHEISDKELELLQQKIKEL